MGLIFRSRVRLMSGRERGCEVRIQPRRARAPTSCRLGSHQLQHPSWAELLSEENARVQGTGQDPAAPHPLPSFSSLQALILIPQCPLCPGQMASAKHVSSTNSLTNHQSNTCLQ